MTWPRNHAACRAAEPTWISILGRANGRPLANERVRRAGERVTAVSIVFLSLDNAGLTWAEIVKECGPALGTGGASHAARHPQPLCGLAPQARACRLRACQAAFFEWKGDLLADVTRSQDSLTPRQAVRFERTEAVIQARRPA